MWDACQTCRCPVDPFEQLRPFGGSIVKKALRVAWHGRSQASIVQRAKLTSMAILGVPTTCRNTWKSVIAVLLLTRLNGIYRFLL